MPSKIETVERFGRVRAAGPGKHGEDDLRVSADVTADALEFVPTAAETVALAGWMMLAQKKVFKEAMHTGRLSIAGALAEATMMDTTREIRLLAELVQSAWERRRGW